MSVFRFFPLSDREYSELQKNNESIGASGRDVLYKNGDLSPSPNWCLNYIKGSLGDNVSSSAAARGEFYHKCLLQPGFFTKQRRDMTNSVIGDGIGASTHKEYNARDVERGKIPVSKIDAAHNFMSNADTAGLFDLVKSAFAVEEGFVCNRSSIACPFDDSKTGPYTVRLRFKPDFIVEDSDGICIYDLKTIGSNYAHLKLNKIAHDRRDSYEKQAAFYMWAVRHAYPEITAGKQIRFKFLLAREFDPEGTQWEFRFFHCNKPAYKDSDIKVLLYNVDEKLRDLEEHLRKEGRIYGNFAGAPKLGYNIGDPEFGSELI